MATEKSIHLAVVSPSRSVFEGDVESVQLPASDGMLGVMPGHAAMLALLGYGKVTIHTNQDDVQEYYVSGGFFEVKENRVTVLADDIELLSELNREQAQAHFDSIASKKVTGEALDDHLDELQAARVRSNLANSR